MSAASIDPELTGAQLQELAAAQPELAPEILNHPNCYPELAEWINTYLLADPAVGGAADSLALAEENVLAGAASEATQLGATTSVPTQLRPLDPAEAEPPAPPLGPVPGSLGAGAGAGAVAGAVAGAAVQPVIPKKIVVLWSAAATIIAILAIALVYVFMTKSPPAETSSQADPTGTATAGAANPKAQSGPPADAEAIKKVDFTTLTWKAPGFGAKATGSTKINTFTLQKTEYGRYCSPNEMDNYLCFANDPSDIFYVDLDGDKRLDAVTDAVSGVSGVEGAEHIFQAWIWNPQTQKPEQIPEPFYVFQSGEYDTRNYHFTADPKYPNAVNIHFDDWLDFWENGLENEPKKVPNTAEDRVFGWKDGKMVQLAGKTGQMAPPPSQR